VSLTWSLSESRFNEVFEAMNFYDSNFTRDIVPILFRETVTSDKNTFGNLSPSQGCVRHQFLN